MTYFITDVERKNVGGTCFHEFYYGKWNRKTGTFWNENSLYIHDDRMRNVALGALFLRVLPSYNAYGVTEVNRTQWEIICAQAHELGGCLEDAIQEIKPWVQSVFNEHTVFTILGI